MMFSERLEYGKYDLQHLQGTARIQNLLNFEGFDLQQFTTILQQFTTIHVTFVKNFVGKFHMSDFQL